MFRLLVVFAALLYASFLSAQDQRRAKQPARPKLAAGADTNSAAAYYLHGLLTLGKRPREAANAFYWASRLRPGWAEPLAARRVALHLRDRRRLAQYLQGVRHVVESAEVRRIDSLQYLALVHDPFVHRAFERRLIEELLGGWAMQEALWGVRDPATGGWLAYTEGKFGRAAELFAKALKKSPKVYELHLPRAHAFYLMGAYDSAQHEMTRLLDEMRRRDEKKLVRFYESKAMFEYSLGLIHTRRNDLEAAREAFGQALLEDLSFYMAHAHLGAVAMARGDTTTALNEFDLAVQIKGDDGTLRFTYGLALLSAGRHAEAAEQLAKTIECEPYFAAPYYYLGRLLDAQGKYREALQQYTRFLNRAERKEPAVEWTFRRVMEINGAPTPADAP